MYYYLAVNIQLRERPAALAIYCTVYISNRSRGRQTPTVLQSATIYHLPYNK